MHNVRTPGKSAGGLAATCKQAHLRVWSCAVTGIPSKGALAHEGPGRRAGAPINWCLTDDNPGSLCQHHPADSAGIERASHPVIANRRKLSQSSITQAQP